MTNSMIPNSFIPGTKAKASEVNENFIALANAITANKNSATSEIQSLNTTISGLSETINTQKADKSELFSEFTVSEENTDLNNYKTKGTYIFSETYIPLNAPKEAAGMLIIVGDKTSTLNQTWICNGNAMYTRTFQDDEWSDWLPLSGVQVLTNPGYFKFPGSDLMLSWGIAQARTVTYPLAFKNVPATVFTKQGCNGSASRSDTGLAAQYATGFTMATVGQFEFLNYITIGT